MKRLLLWLPFGQVKDLAGQVQVRTCLSMPECWAACSGRPVCSCAEPSAWYRPLRLTSCPLSLSTSSSARILLLSACSSALLTPAWP